MSSIIINTSRIAIPKKELTEAEIAKRNFNKMSAADRINTLYDNDININNKLDLYENLLKAIINKIEELHQDEEAASFNTLLSTDTWYIAFETNETTSIPKNININRFVTMFNVVNCFNVTTIESENDSYIVLTLSDEYQTEKFKPKYFDIIFSNNIEDVKTYTKNEQNKYVESDSSNRIIYSITREKHIITKTSKAELVTIVTKMGTDGFMTSNNEIYPGYELNARSINNFANKVENYFMDKEQLELYLPFKFTKYDNTTNGQPSNQTSSQTTDQNGSDHMQNDEAGTLDDNP